MSDTHDNRATVGRAAVAGVAAGILAGLFGVGGGLIIVPIFVLWLRMEQRISNGTSLAAVIPIAISGAIGYASLGQIDWQVVAFVLSGAVIGAAYGAKLLHQVRVSLLQQIFAVLLTATALRLIWSAQPSAVFDGPLAKISLVVVGLFAGTLSGLLGVGGGIIIVPSLILLAGTSPEVARGSSLAIIVGSSISGAIAHYRRNNIRLPIAASAGLFGIPAAFFGTWLSEQLSERVIVGLFALLLLYTARRMWLQSRK